jgi:hypothetical protein
LKELLFLGIIEAAAVNPLFRIFVCAEQHIPPSDVTIVILVTIVLMVNAVHFGALKNEANPTGSFDIRMIEKLT